MINFRYHIVSLMAVFLALSVGIAVGVSLGPSVDQGLLRQAEQDRKQVAELRNEINRRNALEEYREAYDEQAGEPVIDGALRDVRVALVTMPDAPGRVVTRSHRGRGEGRGAPWCARSRSDPTPSTLTRSEALTEALAGLADQIPLTEDMTQAEKVGVALARSVASPQAGGPRPARPRPGHGADPRRVRHDQPEHRCPGTAGHRGDGAGDRAAGRGRAAHRPRPALPRPARARRRWCWPGPTASEIEGTDVLAARTDPEGSQRLSTVDVADLSSGVVTTVLAGQEQLLGREGQHYGALARAEAPLPTLPVR